VHPTLNALQLAFKPVSWEQAYDLQEKYGKNIISTSKPPRWYHLLWGCIVHPFNAILAILAITAGATGDYRTMTVMVLMIFLSVGLRFFQEFKSAVAAEALKTMVQNKVTVLRLYKFPEDRDPTFADVERMEDVIRQEIPLIGVVPGDIVALSAGDMIPGDCILVESRDLFISQSALTGEALPVEKTCGTGVPPSDAPLDLSRSDLVFMGSSVVSGTARAAVLRTGDLTVFGELAKKLAKARPRTAFQKGINAISIMFITIMLVMLPIVLVVSGLTQGNWFQAFLFTISVAVGLTPEMLPMIVNANLAKGALVMSRQRTIVKHLASIIDFGSIDVLCTDKTGTLTIDKVVLMKYLGILSPPLSVVSLAAS
jgi:Mg2+-importing ATPase